MLDPLPFLHTETAVNIGYSCKMLTDDMTEVFIISGHTVQSVRQELRSVWLCAHCTRLYTVGSRINAKLQMTGGQKLRNVCMIEVGRCGSKMFQLLCENHSTVTRAS